MKKMIRKMALTAVALAVPMFCGQASAVVVSLPNASFPASPMFTIDCPGCLFHDGTMDGTLGSIINNDDLKDHPSTGMGGVSGPDEIAYYNDTNVLPATDVAGALKTATAGGGGFGPDDQHIAFSTASEAIWFTNDGPAGYSVFLYNPNGQITVTYEGSGMAAGLSHFATDVAPSAVPIPAALPLFLTALTGLGFIARRRKQTA